MVVGALARLIDVIDGASFLCRSTQRTNPGAGHDDRWDVVNQHALAAVGRTMAPKTKQRSEVHRGRGRGGVRSIPASSIRDEGASMRSSGFQNKRHSRPLPLRKIQAVDHCQVRAYIYMDESRSTKRVPAHTG